jgi:hypothetical protein
MIFNTMFKNTIVCNAFTVLVRRRAFLIDEPYQMDFL